MTPHEQDSCTYPPTDALTYLPTDLQGGSQKLLRRLRRSKTARVSEAHNDFRRELERAASADTTLTVVDLSGRADFAALSAGHKAQAIRMLSIAALEGGLEEVHLDSLELDLACAEAIATLLRAPRLRVLTLTANKLNEAAMQCIARGLHKHPSLTTLALSDQQCGAISTDATQELLDAMETVPTLTKLRLGTIAATVHNLALRRRHVTLESERAGMPPSEVEAINVALFGSMIDGDTSSPPAMRSSTAPAVSQPSPGQQRLYRKVPSAYSPPLAIGGVAGKSAGKAKQLGAQPAVGRAEPAALPIGGRLHRDARAASCTALHLHPGAGHSGVHRGGTVAVQPLPSTYRGLTPVSAFHSPDRPSTFGPSFGHAPGHGFSGRLTSRGVTPTRPNSPGTIMEACSADSPWRVEASADSPWPSFHPPLLDERSAGGGWPGAWAAAWPRGGDDMGGTSRGSSPYPSTPLSWGNSRPPLASDQM